MTPALPDNANTDGKRAQRIVEAMMAEDAFSRWLGIEVVAIEPGSATLKMTVRPEMVNGFDLCHGGITFSLADSAFAFASNGRGRLALALDANIAFPARVVPDDVLTARAEEVSVTNRTGVYTVAVTNQEGNVVAVLRGTVYRTSVEYGDDGAFVASDRDPAERRSKNQRRS